MSEILFIQGVHKTGTSTLVGMLNCHPQILMLYEIGMEQSMISRGGNELLANLSEARQFFRNCSDIGTPCKNFAAYLNKHMLDKNYRYIGDKIISFDTTKTQRYKTIYALRDVRTWLCKKQIVRYYRTDLDIVPVAIDYLRHIIGTYRHPNCLRIRLEDLIYRNHEVLSSLSSFLGLNLVVHANEWWLKLGQYSNEDPKGWIEWFNRPGHASSKVKPNKMDTEVEIRSNPFWDDFLPIFDKYYNEDIAVNYTTDERNNDLGRLEGLMGYSPLPLNECYSYVFTQKLGIEQNVQYMAWNRLKWVLVGLALYLGGMATFTILSVLGIIG